jgi:hypothetical protein
MGEVSLLEEAGRIARVFARERLLPRARELERHGGAAGGTSGGGSVGTAGGEAPWRS